MSHCVPAILNILLLAAAADPPAAADAPPAAHPSPVADPQTPPVEITPVLHQGDPAPGLEPGTIIDATPGFGLLANLSDNPTIRTEAYPRGPDVNETNDRVIHVGPRDHYPVEYAGARDGGSVARGAVESAKSAIGGAERGLGPGWGESLSIHGSRSSDPYNGVNRVAFGSARYQAGERSTRYAAVVLGTPGMQGSAPRGSRPIPPPRSAPSRRGSP